MVLESIINPLKAEKTPWEMFFVGILYSSVAILFSLWIFRQYSSLIMVFLTVTVSVPLMYSTMKLEERKDLDGKSEKALLKEHWKAIDFLLYLFFGFLVSFTIWYIVLPPDLVQTMFSTQIETISSINSRITGMEITDMTSLFLSDAFRNILFNNIKVLIFCILFAFFYGAGAIFILTWNASVISAAVGTFIRNGLAEYASVIGWKSAFIYLNLFTLGIFRYMTHGIFEIAAYFIGGLAGAIVSFGIINHDFRTKRFKYVMFDALSLLIIAIVILFIAALIEVFITPALF